ncbi:MAG TPA: DUF4160 domain-containing protein [Oligoflexia bacterium]|nr:DUF4160 domain-containing protein [Oligoflexia bacterium]
MCRFFGIIIAMFYKDHDPPHFHAIYGDQMGLIEITSRKIEINLSSRTQKIVLEWLDINEKDILENWELAKQKKPLIKIKPLD